MDETPVGFIIFISLLLYGFGGFLFGFVMAVVLQELKLSGDFPSNDRAILISIWPLSLFLFVILFLFLLYDSGRISECLVALPAKIYKKIYGN